MIRSIVVMRALDSEGLHGDGKHVVGQEDLTVNNDNNNNNSNNSNKFEYSYV